MSRMVRERAFAVDLRASGLANAAIAERLGVSLAVLSDEVCVVVVTRLRRRDAVPA